jgi:protein-S-isoprenylcysteine O-methyltransferase Ste14
MDRLPTLGPRGEGWVVIQVVLLAGVVLAGVAGVDEPAWGEPLRLVTTALGLALAALGGWQVVRGTRDLGSNLTPLPHPTATAKLVEAGIYRRVRHPIYGGIILGGLGWGLLTAAPVALGLAILLVPLFWLKSAVEERWLEARFPAYPSYRRRTRRFIAWPG